MEDTEQTKTPSIRLDGSERIHTFGGEAWVDKYQYAEYGIDFEKGVVLGIKPAQAIVLAQRLLDHLMLCGHRFEIVKTGEQDQRERLIAL
jgi:hypothetical protein